MALRKKIVSLEKTVASTSKRALDETGITLDDVFKFLDRKYPEQYCKLLKAQLSLINKAPKGSRYSDEFKQFALSVYFLGPKAYKKFSTICRLPSKSTLHRFTKNWIVEPGFNDFIFRVIEYRIGLMKEKERDCILCLDEISLKSHLYYDISRDKIVGFQTSLNGTSTDIASSALTVMVRGLASNWKIPLAYFFYKTSATSDDLKDILFKTVRRCKSIGLNVMGVVSDQGSNFQKLVKTLNVTDENPIFLIDDHKLVYLFDIPHLLKSTRNNLFSYQFLLQGGETRKHYIETMYNYDRTKQYKLAPKLNNDHIYPNNFQKMKVKLASQVLSHSVAVAMHTYIDFNILPKEALVTADFIKKMNDLFDLLNSSNFEKCQAFMGTEKQMKCLQEAYVMFQNLQVKNHDGKNVTKQLKFIFGWKLTLKAVFALWEMLKERDYKYLFTRNLNQDCLENFFGQIRNCSGNAKNPTPIQFCRAFKKIFALKYFDSSEGANCMDDVNDVLLSLTPELTEQCRYILARPDIPNYAPLKVFTRDYKNLKSPEGNALVYVTGYLMKKCLMQHSCDICIDFSKSSENLLDQDVIFCKLKAYSTDKSSFGGLTVPSRDIVDHVIEMENIFIENFDKIGSEKGIGQYLKTKYSKILFSHPCQKFPFDYYISLYTRVRIYFTLKFMNQDMKIVRKHKSCNVKLNILNHL